ncbi:MAG: hypothetical protein MI919_29655, partial [Holophagales bacterium]|nr:hypothetical protein [Holophagales bacterium]
LGCLRHLSGGEPRRRLLALALLIHGLALIAHPYKLPRFATSLAFLLASAAAVSLVDLLFRAVPRAARAVALVLVLATWAAVWDVGAHEDFVRREHRQRTVEASEMGVLELLSDPVLRRDGLLVLGLWDGLSPALVEWHVRRRDRAVAAGAHQPSSIPLPANGIEEYRRDSGRLLRSLSEPSSRYGRLAALTAIPPAGTVEAAAAGGGGGARARPGGDPLPGERRRVFEADTAWLAPVTAAFRRGELPYVLEATHSFPGSSYRLVVLRRKIDVRDSSRGPGGP